MPQHLEDLALQFRDAMAAVCTPVSVVTAMDGDRPHGTTVSAFASLSMSPPSVLVSLDRASEVLALVQAAGRFGLNVLSSDQSRLAVQFARKGADKFVGATWSLDHEVPKLANASHWIAAEVMQVAEVADRIVVFGAVVGLESSGEPPLTYFDRVFGTHAPLPPTMPGAMHSLPPRLRAVAGGWG